MSKGNAQQTLKSEFDWKTVAEPSVLAINGAGDLGRVTATGRASAKGYLDIARFVGLA